MHTGELPPKGLRVSRLIADGGVLPQDPVGTAVAEILVELLDGIVVELSYARPPDIQHQWMYNAPTQTAVADRNGPGPWHTVIVVNVAGGAAGLCAQGRVPPQLPGELAGLPIAAFRAADDIAIQSGLDGNVITAPLHRALQESVVIEILAGEVARLSNRVLEAVAVRGLVTSILYEFDRIASTTVEGEPLSLGVVLRPTRSADASGHRYPDDYAQKRVPLLFDGRSAVLVVDSGGYTELEVQRSRPERRLLDVGALEVFTQQLGEQGGSLVAAVSRAYDALGFYAHPDHSIWVYSAGSPLLVRRGGRWRAIPMAAFSRGIAEMARSDEPGGMAAAAAVLLSLQGHGGIIAIVESGEDLEGCVQAKDRVDTLSSGPSLERAVHDVLDIEEIDTATLVRLASIDGATVLDRSGRVVAYGAIVTSSDSVAEGARTAAARTLSRYAEVVLKVSEDGPITIFCQGEEVAHLLE